MSQTDKAQLRVIQRNLVYVTNIDSSITLDQLRSSQFFGQYGQLKKITLRQNAPGKPQAAYVIYKTDEEALDCMYSVSDAWFNGLQLKAQFGTSKFCLHYLNGTKCTNPDCLFLHEQNDKMQMFLGSQMNKQDFLRETRPVVPEPRQLFDKNRKQVDCFPPSYFKVQATQNETQNQVAEESDQHVFIRCAQAFCSDQWIWS